MAPRDLARENFLRAYYLHFGCKTKEIITETERVYEGNPDLPYCPYLYGRMEIVKIDPRRERIVKEKREIHYGRLRSTVITRERELSEVATFVDKHHRFIASLKELDDAPSEKGKLRALADKLKSGCSFLASHKNRRKRLYCHAENA